MGGTRDNAQIEARLAKLKDFLKKNTFDTNAALKEASSKFLKDEAKLDAKLLKDSLAENTRATDEFREKLAADGQKILELAQSHGRPRVKETEARFKNQAELANLAKGNNAKEANIQRACEADLKKHNAPLEASQRAFNKENEKHIAQMKDVKKLEDRIRLQKLILP